MKRHSLYFAIVICCLLLAGCSTTSKTPEEIKEAKIASYLKKGYMQEDAEILAMSKQERLEYLCPFYGIPVDSKDYNLKDSRFKNVIYAYVVGNYGVTIPASDKKTAESVIKNHGDIVSFYINEKSVQKNGNGFVFGREGAMFSDEVLFLRQVKALRIIKRMHDQMHEKGRITDGMTEMEIAKACVRYLQEEVGIHVDKVHPSSTIKGYGRLQDKDSIYNCVIGSFADCGPRGAVLAILLHLEGIKAQTTSVDIYIDGKRNGHILCRAILDGQEYYIDWQYLMYEAFEIPSQSKFIPDSMAVALF